MSSDDARRAGARLPGDRLVTVPHTVTPAQVQARCAETGFSRFPVARPGR